MYNFTEIQRFIIFIIDGVIFSLFFDFFISIRKNFKANFVATNFEDLIFFTIISIIFIYSFIYLCNGVMRIYVILGIIFGITIYVLTIRRICAIIFDRIMMKSKCFFTFLLKFVKKLGKLFKI